MCPPAIVVRESRDRLNSTQDFVSRSLSCTHTHSHTLDTKMAVRNQTEKVDTPMLQRVYTPQTFTTRAVARRPPSKLSLGNQRKDTACTHAAALTSRSITLQPWTNELLFDTPTLPHLHTRVLTKANDLLSSSWRVGRRFLCGQGGACVGRLRSATSTYFSIQNSIYLSPNIDIYSDSLTLQLVTHTIVYSYSMVLSQCSTYTTRHTMSASLLRGKKVLMTGASSGIGECACASVETTPWLVLMQSIDHADASVCSCTSSFASVQCDFPATHTHACSSHQRVHWWYTHCGSVVVHE